MKNNTRLISVISIILSISVLFFISLVNLSVDLSAVEKRAFTIEDLYKIKSLGGLDISPDGSRLLFSVREYNLPKGTSKSNIFMLNLKTGQQKQLTFSCKNDTNPYWSSCGKKIYFLSNREEGTQLWEMDATGGEAHRVSGFYTGIGSPTPSKTDGKLYFTSTVFAECMADCNCNKEQAEKLANGNVQAHMADELFYRHWNYFRDWQYTHLFCLDRATKKVNAITQGKIDYPPFSLAGHADFDISPDGKTAVIVSNHDKNLPHSTNSDLFLIDLTSKDLKPVNITDANNAYDGGPEFSPDGNWIAFLTQKVPGYEADRFRLALYNIKTREIKVLTETIDNWVDGFKWSSDSRYIYFVIEETGYSPLYRVSVKTGKLERILEGQAIREFTVSPDGKSLVFIRTSVGEPFEIWQYRIGKKNGPKRLTFVNKSIEDTVDIRPAEEHWVVGAAGKKIQLFVVKPHGFDPAKTYPLILNVHGGPQQMWFNSFRGDWQVYPGAGYIVAFANPHGSPGYGQEFTEAISKDWTGKVMEDFDKVSQYLSELPYVDKERMGAMGWSWGGYAMMWMEGHNKYFKALAAMMGIYNARSMYSGTEELWYPAWDFGKKPWEDPEMYRSISPSSYVKSFKTPCLIITGERDYRVPYTMSVEFFTDLREMGVPARLIIFKNDGHWPNMVKSMPVYYNAHLEWFHKYLKGGKAPYDTEKMIRNQVFKQ